VTRRAAAGASLVVYVLAALLPQIGLLLNGQPFSALFNLVLIVFCVVFGLIFRILLLVPSAHAIIAIHMRREERRHREVVEAIRRYGPPPGYGYWRAEGEAEAKSLCRTL
jgi:type IV secretory pathway VirB3-like protein